MTDRSAYLRGQLASVGILLDEPTAPAVEVAAPPPPPELDRARVREILRAAGAPPHHLDWLVASCPSLEAATGYQPPRRR